MGSAREKKRGEGTRKWRGGREGHLCSGSAEGGPPLPLSPSHRPPSRCRGRSRGADATATAEGARENYFERELLVLQASRLHEHRSVRYARGRPASQRRLVAAFAGMRRYSNRTHYPASPELCEFP